MWVEITVNCYHQPFLMSSSSWGCELKYIMLFYTSRKQKRHPLREDVSWNAHIYKRFFVRHSHPLREDVSWNKSHYTKKDFDRLSSSSWGCELKFWCISRNCLSCTSSSSWGCELKCANCDLWVIWMNVILFVRMWVEIQWSCYDRKEIVVILFVRMWVEM